MSNLIWFKQICSKLCLKTLTKDGNFNKINSWKYSSFDTIDDSAYVEVGKGKTDFSNICIAEISIDKTLINYQKLSVTISKSTVIV